MSQLKDFIEIDKKFQNSINLQLDIDSRKKLNSYIPTRSSINILNGFLENVINNKEKANILIGPYGKGKSHLLLVLLAILKESEDKTTEKLLNKIEKISDVPFVPSHECGQSSGRGTRRTRPERGAASAGLLPSTFRTSGGWRRSWKRA